MLKESTRVSITAFKLFEYKSRFFSYILITLFWINLAHALPLHLLQLPPGFKISVYAKVPGARSMALGNNGIVFVGTRHSKIYVLIPNADFSVAKQILTLADNLNTPNGVAFYNNALYVAEINRIIRYENIIKQLDNPPSPVVVNDTFPNKAHHGWRYIKFGPDGWLYIAVGAPCNVCLSDDPRFATLMRLKADGTNLQIYAKGIRNSVGFAWDPLTQNLWFTDNGRDWLGDNLPPDTLNYAPKPGMDFGFPYFHAGIADPKFSKMHSANEFAAPALKLPAHVAALGMIFYTGKMFPEKYRNQIFIVEHGSWNRSTKVGYQVILVTLQNGKAISWQPFVSGWLQGQNDWGRPVDLLVMPDGALLISDDSAGVIYRISYHSG